MEPIIQLTPAELENFLSLHPDAVLLDVREDAELAICSLKDCIHIPMNMIPLRQNELPDDCPIVLYCHHGIRSLHTAMYLSEAGFENLYNLKGGIDAWSVEIDPVVPRY